jgi:DNA (cytosine-5)-methyltransferase 1
MRTVQFVEIDPFCRAVLAKHWPDVPCHDDIRTFHASAGFADVICGGFPCQDISTAGKGLGLAGERSGLWREYARLIGEVQPRFVLVENVAALLSRGLGEVLGDLASLGYDADWHCIPASAVGAPHRRDRVWIVAYASCEPGNGSEDDAPSGVGHEAVSELRNGGGPQALADADRQRLERQRPDRDPEGWERPIVGPAGLCDGASYQPGWWASEPSVGRVADGVPNRVDRLRALGNAVVPAIPYLLGCSVMRRTDGSSEGRT